MNIKHTQTSKNPFRLLLNLGRRFVNWITGAPAKQEKAQTQQIEKLADENIALKDQIKSLESEILHKQQSIGHLTKVNTNLINGVLKKGREEPHEELPIFHKGIAFIRPRTLDDVLAGRPVPEGYYDRKYESGEYCPMPTQGNSNCHLPNQRMD